jgi:hypothetical protein
MLIPAKLVKSAKKGIRWTGSAVYTAYIHHRLGPGGLCWSPVWNLVSPVQSAQAAPRLARLG